MSEANFERMIEICERFVDTNPIDFYQLFELDKSKNIMEITKDIKNKRIRVMFHPDQLGIVPDEYKATFEKICASIPDLANAFSSKENRSKYDSSLENITKTEEQAKNDDNITELEKTNLQNAIVKTASKHGIRQMVRAIVEAMKNNFKGFTSEGYSRSIVENLGSDKIREIVFESSYPDMTKQNYEMSMEQAAANYMSDLINKIDFFSIQAQTVNYAINQTLNRRGEGQVYYAMNKFYKKNDDDTSTVESISSKDARKYMEMYVNPRDVKEILLLLNNQSRFEDASNYYSNTRPQNLDYQINLFMSNSARKRRQAYEEQSGPKY